MEHPSEINYRYYAFISYKREDEEWAKWLQHKLEHYKLPTNLNGRTDLPKEIRPVFKDTSELNPGNLPQQIHNALEQSRYLIVVCSPRSAQSEWVNREVETFIGMGRTDKVIPFIIEGDAISKNPDKECFPQALRNLPAEQEILGANINEMGREAAAVKVVAQMFGLKFDELWQRFEREQRKKRHWLITVSVAGFLVMAAVAFWMYAQRQQTLKANWKMMENRSRFVAEKAQSLVDANDSYLAMRLLLEVFPKDLEHPEIPFTPEAEGAFRNAFAQDNATLKGHDDVVFSTVFSPDGNTVVSTSRDGKINFWDVYTGRLLRTIDMEGKSVIRADFSPDGNQLVTSMERGKVMLWDVNTGNKIHEWDDCTGVVSSVKFSPDGTKIVAASEVVTKVYDVDTKKAVWTTDTIQGIFKSAYFSPDGERVITSSYNDDVKIWDVEDGALVNTIKTDFWINDACFSPDGELIAYAPWDYNAVIQEVESGEVYGEYGKHPEYVKSVDFDPDGLFLLTTSDNTLTLWDVDFEEEIRTLKGHASRVNRAVFSPDGIRIASASDDKTVKLWYTDAREWHRTMGNNGSLWAEFSPDGKWMLSAGFDGVSIFDAQSGVEKTFVRESHLEARCATFSPDGTKVAIAFSGDAYVNFSSAIVMLEIPSFKTTTIYKQDSEFQMVGFSPNGKQLVMIPYLGNDVMILDAQNGSLIQTLKGHQSLVHTAVFFPDGKRIVTSSGDNTVKVWDVETGNPIMTLDKHLNDVDDVIVSPDGTLIASGSTDMTIRIWDALTGEELRVMHGHADDVVCLAFNADGTLLASGSDDNTIKIWDVETGTLLHTIHTWSLFEEETPHHVAFSPNGNQILSALISGAVIWYFPSLQDLIDQTRERFKDCPLTPEERRQYYLE